LGKPYRRTMGPLINEVTPLRVGVPPYSPCLFYRLQTRAENPVAELCRRNATLAERKARLAAGQIRRRRSTDGAQPRQTRHIGSGLRLSS
jgi:hypothetical protein